MSLAVEKAPKQPPFSLEDECSICIESLLDSTNIGELIARVAPCSHCYHDLCIRSWSEQANSCPKCRAKFNLVELLDRAGNVICDYQVKDKAFPVDPNYLAPEPSSTSDNESLVASIHRTPLVITSLTSASSLLPFAITCSLCAATSTTSNVSVCQNCTSTFHPHCLGMSDTYVGYWNCPMCDCMQESSLLANGATVRRTRRNRLTRRTDSTYERLMSDHRNELQRHHRGENSNITSNRSNEISNGSHICSTLNNSASNADALRARVNPDEEEAWKQFEMVRKTEDASSTSRRGVSPKKKKKVNSSVMPSHVGTSNASASTSAASSTRSTGRKLKRPSRRGKPNFSRVQKQEPKTEKPALPATSGSASTSGSSSPVTSTSRVMSLLSEMHSNSQTLLQGSTISSTTRRYEPQRLYGQLSPPMSPGANDSKIDSEDSSSAGKMKITFD